ncbi:hypothetical protein GCM10010442_36600 [Kitasatospora kifunensis]
MGALGAPVIPTVVIGEPSEGFAVVAGRGWGEAVLKPATGLGGRLVQLLSRADTAGLEAGGAREWVVQRFLPGIRDEGELSLVNLEGRPGHAIRRWPGDPAPADLSESPGSSRRPAARSLAPTVSRRSGRRTPHR